MINRMIIVISGRLFSNRPFYLSPSLTDYAETYRTIRRFFRIINVLTGIIGTVASKNNYFLSSYYPLQNNIKLNKVYIINI